MKAIRKQDLIRPGDRVAAAVSGGADSVALLFLLLELRAELGIVLSVAHVNHKLRGEESDTDQRFVEELCRAHDLELHCRTAPLTEQRSGIEAAARELRYEYFRKLARASPGLKVATGHTLDDQAETVFLRILRGTGIRGLAGIHARLVMKDKGQLAGEVVRPLLGFRRGELQEFLRERGQSWREDSTNRESRFLRNRIRNTVFPLLGEPVVENLADLAEIARAEDEHWKTSHPEILGHVGDLQLSSLMAIRLAAQRRLIRAWIEAHEPRRAIFFRMIEDVLELAHSEHGRPVQLASGFRICRAHDVLRFERSEPRDIEVEYEYLLPIPGEVAIPELGIRLQACLMNATEVPECDRACLLAADHLPSVLTVRSWRPGDRFWPAHTKAPRKVKELLNDRHITGIEKKLWPVIVARDQLVWVRGFPAPQGFRPQPGASHVISIREKAKS